MAYSSSVLLNDHFGFIGDLIRFRYQEKRLK